VWPVVHGPAAQSCCCCYAPSPPIKPWYGGIAPASYGTASTRHQPGLDRSVVPLPPPTAGDVVVMSVASRFDFASFEAARSKPRHRSVSSILDGHRLVVVVFGRPGSFLPSADSDWYQHLRALSLVPALTVILLFPF
jgi:hypothetical protein